MKDKKQDPGCVDKQEWTSISRETTHAKMETKGLKTTGSQEQSSVLGVWRTHEEVKGNAAQVGRHHAKVKAVGLQRQGGAREQP